MAFHRVRWQRFNRRDGGPIPTLMRPLRPYFVHKSRGRNHSTSSGQLNIHRTTAFVLCTFTGKPVSTIFFRLMRSGSLLFSVPAQPAPPPPHPSPQNATFCTTNWLTAGCCKSAATCRHRLSERASEERRCRERRGGGGGPKRRNLGSSVFPLDKHIHCGTKAACSAQRLR